MKVVDTTFLIDLLLKKGGIEKALDKFASEQLLTTRISVFEVLIGIYNNINFKLIQERLSQANMLFRNLQVLELDEKSTYMAAEIYGDLRRRNVFIGVNDCLIAGITISNGINTIVTKNIKDFSKIRGLSVESY